MAGRRELIESEDFARRRGVAALVRGDALAIEDVPRRPNAGLLLGLVVVVLVAAGSAATAFLTGRAVVGLAAVGWAVALGGGPAARGLVVAAVVLVVGVLVRLGGALRAAAAGDDGLVAWWHRPRTQRWLGWLETTAAVAVLPLLAGVLGVYAAAADAGARL